jgi:transaldolase
MKFFLDTANVSQIREAASWGILDGVTTNPTLVSKEKGRFEDIIKEICSVVLGPVSVESVSTKAEDIVEESRKLAKLAENVVIKIPICVEGLKATKVLSQEEIHINTTLVFSPIQALLAAKAGTRYVSPFVGRLDDISHEGINLVDEIAVILDNYGFDTEIIVGSVRHPLHVVESALIGADIVTVPFAVLERLVKHPLTDIGMERFLDDWKKVKKK